MRHRRLWSDIRISMGWFVIVALLHACGGEQAANEDASETSQVPAATGSVIARADFVLCPAIEAIADELAERIGFERDRERRVAGIGSECFVRGVDAGWVRVALPPAMIRSVTMQARGYDGEATPAPELGESAVFIEAQVQPHVVFELLGQIIDVGIEHSGYGSPDRATVIGVAEIVRDALLSANAG